MRLKSALPVLAGGLLLGWAGLAAAADAAPPPPAAPIFYCPSAPPKAGAPAAAPRACPAPAQVAQPAHRAQVRVHRRYERRYVGRAAPSQDVSASQAFIYRYERAQHGLDARAADAAWGMGGPPPCPMHMQGPHGCMPHHREWAEGASPPPQPPPPPPQPQVIVEHAPPAPQQVIVERAPPPPQQVIIEREAPPPPNVIIEHAPAPPPRVVFERAPPPPPVVIHERAPACPERCPTYGWEHHGRAHGGYADRGYARSGYRVERSESEHSGGWRYTERNGQGHYESWGDGARGGACPPRVVEAGGCAAAGSAYASGEAGWQDGSYGNVYGYQGRDAYGYLVWPGK